MVRPDLRSRGFTLIEVLVVLAIVGVLAAAGVYYTQDKSPAAVRVGLSELAGAIRNAQGLARSSGQSVFLRATGGGKQDPMLEWGFVTFDDTGKATYGVVQGAWTVPAGQARFVSFGVDKGTLSDAGVNPSPSSVSSITLNTSSTSIWETSLFPGSSTANNAFWFRPNGAVNSEFFVSVAGRRGGEVYSKANTAGVVIVNPVSGITVFLKKDTDNDKVKWARL